MSDFVYNQENNLPHELQYAKHLLSQDIMPTDIQFTNALNDYISSNLKEQCTETSFKRSALAAFVRLYWAQEKGVSSVSQNSHYESLFVQKDSDGLTWADKLKDVIDIESFSKRQKLVDSIAKQNDMELETIREPLLLHYAHEFKNLIKECDSHSIQILFDEGYGYYYVKDDITGNTKMIT